MGRYSFSSYVQKRHSADDLFPEADKVVPLVAQAGARGMTRSEIGGVIDLEPEDLNALLDALVRSGLLTVTWHNETPVYRAPAAGA